MANFKHILAKLKSIVGKSRKQTAKTPVFNIPEKTNQKILDELDEFVAKSVKRSGMLDGEMKWAINCIDYRTKKKTITKIIELDYKVLVERLKNFEKIPIFNEFLEWFFLFYGDGEKEINGSFIEIERGLKDKHFIYFNNFQDWQAYGLLSENEAIKKSEKKYSSDSKMRDIELNLENKTKTIQPPKNDTLKWNEIFNSIDEYNETITELKSKSFINEHTQKWQLETAGKKTTLIFILKKMSILGYYNNTPKADEYKLIAKNTFGIDIGIDAINKTQLNYKSDNFLKTWNKKQ